MFDYLKYDIWPLVKVRATYWWWVVKYGGKENIPPELIFGRIAQNLQRVEENLQKTLQNLPDEATDEEVHQIIELLHASGHMGERIEEIKRENIEDGQSL